MPLPPLATTFPNARLVDSAGNVSLPWRTFLLALWRRTGAVAGVDGGAASTQIAAETAARQAQDIALSNAISGEAAARTAAIAAEAAVRAASDAHLSDSGTDATTLLTIERTARIAADATETAARIAGDAAAPKWALLVTGDVPVGIVCTPDGVPVYVTE
jgi:hypothetical protein